MRVKRDIRKDVKQPLFQFRYDERKGKFLRELRDPHDDKKVGRANWLEERHKYEPMMTLQHNESAGLEDV